MRIFKLVAAAVFLLGAMSAHAEKTDLKLTGSQGVNFFFTMSNPWASDKVYILNTAERFCADKPVCIAHFYLTGTAAPKGFPLSDSEVEVEIATYNKNKNTGLNRILWNCSKFSGVPSSSCF
ncbi:hypothetical protein EXW72_10080 [Pseudomonas sp. BCA14]|uniref:hypothetical protein n=1 Tax=unclassified Pseudomonas TaxID=196821 RepID=UPI00106EBDDC|nr:MULTISPECIES: hypothetical protein [unclassified Pseudomonas]TFF09668.1 hypothetical protein EXW70_11580 [Pseudomonas sp. JMN1]TFF11810.1 hypothetical protein EXW71_09330 [Pseudomonas sp. BCA17]TFF28586.1 hypothetical protein EXW72_10080 [Pseudomonas sp. BCA14]